ncbi:hypothetical protein CEXT_123001 [Caerostris extrusa]|uniref:Uncharacterized protein n=1 Tax=Caerostris extrusa TaxID=172846 RepID=A0AAV4PUL5_CAEEX|nr:hypothetical protein CEXT_123001 [Caerostris extrusa]
MHKQIECTQTLEESVTEDPLNIQTQLFTRDSPRDWKLFQRFVFMQEESLRFQCTIFKKHSSQIFRLYWKQALARHSKHPDRKVLLKPQEALQQSKEKALKLH